MRETQRGRRASRRRRRAKKHVRSMRVICAVIALLSVMVFYNCMTLRAKEAVYSAKEQELEQLIAEETARTKEIEELEQYVGTDEYIEQIAKEKLGLIGENEIIFKAE